MSHYVRSPVLATPGRSLLIMIDIQEKLAPLIDPSVQLIQNCEFLCRVAQHLEIPIVGTEQYPQGLGKTVTDLRPYLDQPIAKTRFSSVEALDYISVDQSPDSRGTAILIGIETHICVLQTALDLMAAGFEVVIPVDAVGSRLSNDHQWAIRRLSDSGVTVTTVESLAFEWCETAQHPQFKAISQLVKSLRD